MMAGNLSIVQRKWILKQYWKTENAERVRTAWVEALNTPPPTGMKNKVYERKPQTVDEMKESITDAFMDIQTASCVELCVIVFLIGWMHVVTLMEDISST